MIIDYMVVVVDDAETLNEFVKSNILEGWQPFGGVSVVMLKPYKDEMDVWYTFSQAMVKYEEKIK